MKTNETMTIRGAAQNKQPPKCKVYLLECLQQSLQGKSQSMMRAVCAHVKHKANVYAVNGQSQSVKAVLVRQMNSEKEREKGCGSLTCNAVFRSYASGVQTVMHTSMWLDARHARLS